MCGCVGGRVCVVCGWERSPGWLCESEKEREGGCVCVCVWCGCERDEEVSERSRVLFIRDMNPCVT